MSRHLSASIGGVSCDTGHSLMRASRIIHHLDSTWPLDIFKHTYLFFCKLWYAADCDGGSNAAERASGYVDLNLSRGAALLSRTSQKATVVVESPGMRGHAFDQAGRVAKLALKKAVHWAPSPVLRKVNHSVCVHRAPTKTELQRKGADPRTGPLNA